MNNIILRTKFNFVLFLLFSVVSSEAKPNILFIIVDDLRPQLGCYGHKEVISPNLDKLANQGILFNRAYCQVPVCGATRCNIFSAIRPTDTTFKAALERLQNYFPNATTLPAAFKSNGYYSISNGKVFHYSNDMEKSSWSESAWVTTKDNLTHLDPDSKNYLDSVTGRGPFFEAAEVSDTSYPDGELAEKTIKDLIRLKNMNKPFFLACGFHKPHLPFYAPKKYWDLYNQNSLAIADNRYRPANAPKALQGSDEIGYYSFKNIVYNSDDFHKSGVHGYLACVSYVDAQIGKVINYLDTLGLRDSTIIVIVGDHGWNLGEHNFWSKQNLTHNSMNGTLIIAGPGISKGVTSNALVEYTDIYPTLCALANIPLTPQMTNQIQGTSFTPLIRNPSQPWKSAVFSRFTPQDKGRAIITERYTYSEYQSGGSGPGFRMLYDLKIDPKENINISELPANAALVDSLSKILRADWKAQSIPLGATVIKNRNKVSSRVTSQEMLSGQESKVKVYTLTGELVKNVKVRMVKERLHIENGAECQNGIYLYSVKTKTGQSLKGKFASPNF